MNQENTEAIEYYDRALEIEPNKARTWYNKGVGLDNLGEHDEAMKCYDKSMELSPNDFMAWYNEDAKLYSQGQVNKQ